MAALGDKNVGGLDVAVNNALGMRGVQSIRDLNREREHGFVIQRPSRDEMLQGDAIQKLHGDERLLPVFADFVDGTNIGVVEGGGGPRLPAKAFESLRIARHFLGQELEGDEAAKLRVFGFVNHAHASAAKFLDDAIVRDDLVDHGGEAELANVSSYGCWRRSVNEYAQDRHSCNIACRTLIGAAWMCI